MRDDTREILIATLRRGRREELRVTAIDHNGHRTIRIRSWFLARDGTYRPGKEGISFKADVAADLASVLRQAIAKASLDQPLRRTDTG
jgi:hypothetical protein